MAKTRAVLIIGGSGFIGTHLALKLREGYKVFATYNSQHMSIPGVTFVPLSVSNKNWVKRVVYTANPDVIIYAAGSNDFWAAENDQREAEETHTGGPATVSNVSDILQPKFIYLSNCYTFDGRKGNYHETDIVLPSSIMGKSKVGGENFIRGKSLNYVIVRSSPVFGRANGWKRSMLDRIRMNLDRGQRFEMPTADLHSFAPVSGLVDFVCRLVDSGPKNKILHYGGLTKVTHHQFAVAFAQRFGYDPSLVLKARPTVKQNDETVEVPEGSFDYSLNSSHIIDTLKIKPLELAEGLELLARQLTPPVK